MLNPDQRSVLRQGEIIEQLRLDLRHASSALDKWASRYNAARSAQEFFSELQRLMADNPALRSEWDRFCVVLKMTADEDFVKRHRDKL